MNAKDAFHAAADVVESRVAEIDDKSKLRLYGLFKQASSGPCSTAKPSYFDFKGRAKWSAWDSVRDLSQEEAMHSYVDLVSSFFPGCQADGDQPQKREAPAGPVFSSLAHNAATEELATDLVIKLLLSRGADVNAKDEDGQTPLQYALLCDHNQICKQLEQAGALQHQS